MRKMEETRVQETGPEGRTLRERVTGLVILVLAAIIVLVTLTPLVFLFVTSLQSRDYILQLPPKIVGFPPVDWNYLAVLGYRITVEQSASLGDFPRFLANSAVICGGATTLAALVGTMAAYAFVRYYPSFPRVANNLSFFVLTLRFLPPVAIIVPLFILYDRMGFVNTFYGMILIYTIFSLPFSVWMMISFVAGVSKDIEEAAKIDGMTDFQVFRKIVFPIVLPGFIATIVFNLMITWNDFLVALVLTGEQTRTLTVGMSAYMLHGTFAEAMYGQLAAGGLVAAIPIVILVILLRRQFIRGMTLGAIK